MVSVGWHLVVAELVRPWPWLGFASAFCLLRCFGFGLAWSPLVFLLLFISLRLGLGRRSVRKTRSGTHSLVPSSPYYLYFCRHSPSSCPVACFGLFVLRLASAPMLAIWRGLLWPGSRRPPALLFPLYTCFSFCCIYLRFPRLALV